MFMCRSWIREWSDLIAEQHPAASPLEKRDVSSVLCCSVEGPFPQSTAQSVRSSGRDDRWGLGGNVTTHFTGKGGSGSSDFSHLLGFFSSFTCTTHAGCWKGERHTEVERRVCSTNISSGPSTCSRTKRSSLGALLSGCPWLSCPGEIRGFEDATVALCGRG